MTKTPVKFFIKKYKDSERVQFQGYFYKINSRSSAGYFFSWLDGEESDHFVCTKDYISNCVLFDSDYDMNKYIEAHNAK